MWEMVAVLIFAVMFLGPCVVATQNVADEEESV